MEATEFIERIKTTEKSSTYKNVRIDERMFKSFTEYFNEECEDFPEDESLIEGKIIFDFLMSNREYLGNFRTLYFTLNDIEKREIGISEFASCIKPQINN